MIGSRCTHSNVFSQGVLIRRTPVGKSVSRLQTKIFVLPFKFKHSMMGCVKNGLGAVA